MRITIVLPFVNLTGGIRLLLQFANALHDGGDDVTVVYPLWPYRFHFRRRDQLREWRRQIRSDARVDWLDLRCRLRCVPWIADTFLPRADLVVTTSWPAVRSVAALHGSRGSKVHILFHHESGTGPERRICGTYSLPFYRVAFSRTVRQAIETRFGCVVHDVVPAGIDRALFFPDGQRQSATVLMLYHSDPRKGGDDGIQALTALRDRRPDLRVRICGTVWPRRLPGWMTFDFHPSDADLRRFYSTSTALLYPSRDEGFGLPPLEAMSCSCPVVTTNVGAVPEFAIDRQNALVIEPGDIGGMTDALDALLRDSNLQRTLAACGARTSHQYALANVTPLFRDALKRSLDAPRS